MISQSFKMFKIWRFLDYAEFVFQLGFQPYDHIFFAQNLRNFRANIFLSTFLHLLRMQHNKFWSFLRNLNCGICATQEVFLNKTYFCKLTKFIVSAQNQTTEGLFKNWHKNKLWLCCSQIVTFSYKIFKLRDKN